MAEYDKEVKALRDAGMSRAQIAGKLGLSDRQVRSAVERANRDPLVRRVMDQVGSDIEPDAFWKKEDGVSAYYKRKQVNDEEFVSALKESLGDIKPLDTAMYSPRVNHGVKGEYLLVVDNADVHFGKLCISSETGQDYNVEAARHRMIEGTRAIIEGVKGFGVSRILYVMGNDQLHSDDGRATTSGTSQDTDGSYFTTYRAAQASQSDAIKMCSEAADTDLIHCMSNHDWRSGWALSQTIAAYMRGANGIRATDYNMSERHRKYYGFEKNGLLLTHGDGTKEERLLGHFMNEARGYMTDWRHLYAILHHVHHKVAKRRGIDVFQTEKDHNGITAMVTGAPHVEGNSMQIEYVRSPSPPDGWHDRNGYTNRQAVEAFLYHPHDGQKLRFTEWF